MKERPILFNTEMVRAVLDGRKTQTRRILKMQPPENLTRHCWYSAPLYGFTVEPQPAENFWKIKCPFGVVGDRLWVRETWSHTSYPFDSFDSESDTAFFRADYVGDSFSENGDPDKSILGMKRKWIPSIHMPRSASRILLEITKIRVERLNDISEQDAKAEGVEPIVVKDNIPVEGGWARADRHMWKGYKNKERAYRDTAKDSFKSLWEEINGTNSWNKNPWVWVVEFRVIEESAI